jgi:hypothetical protein
MIRPAPATQPWPESTNSTAARAGAWPEPLPEVAVAGALPVQDEDDAAAPGELAEPGVEPVPADAADAPAGAGDPLAPGPAADPDDVAAQPAAEAATASTASAEAAARRVRATPGTRGTRARRSNVRFACALKGISFVTFQMTLYPLARLYRVPRVWSWG